MEYVFVIWLGLLTMFVSGVYRQIVPILRKTIDDQQRQLDDLKRELEEIKTKQ